MFSKLKPKIGFGNKQAPASPAKSAGAADSPPGNSSPSGAQAYVNVNANSSLNQANLERHNQSGQPSPALNVPPATTQEDAPQEAAITRGRVGRSSNRLARRAGQEKSKSLQTMESIMSSQSQADFFQPSQTIIVFDWDDTLCPSHWIRINRPKLHYFQPCPNDPKYKKPLSELEPLVIRVLRRASELGKVVILTNAAPQWVEISSKNFLPGVWPVIQELNIPINYARAGFTEQDMMTCRKAYEYNYNVNIPQSWKEKAFKEEIGKFYSQYLHQSWKNIVSIGDQSCERDACRLVAWNRPTQKKKCRTKTVKLLEEPSVEDLTAELHVINQWLPGIVNIDDELDVDLGEDDDVIFELHQQLVNQQ